MRVAETKEGFSEGYYHVGLHDQGTRSRVADGGCSELHVGIGDGQVPGSIYTQVDQRAVRAGISIGGDPGPALDGHVSNSSRSSTHREPVTKHVGTVQKSGRAVEKISDIKVVRRKSAIGHAQVARSTAAKNIAADRGIHCMRRVD